MANAKATRATSPANSGPLCFVDGSGGAFASLAAGLERAHGRLDVLAGTTSAVVGVPAEIGAVLAEIGLAAPEVVLAAALPITAECVDLTSWRLSLHDGEGDLARLALARIARDSIERRLRWGSLITASSRAADQPALLPCYRPPTPHVPPRGLS